MWHGPCADPAGAPPTTGAPVSKHALPGAAAMSQYAPTIDEAAGQLYYARATTRKCGKHVAIRRSPIGSTASTILASPHPASTRFRAIARIEHDNGPEGSLSRTVVMSGQDRGHHALKRLTPFNAPFTIRTPGGFFGNVRPLRLLGVKRST